jgi:hypothetical protein
MLFNTIFDNSVASWLESEIKYLKSKRIIKNYDIMY